MDQFHDCVKPIQEKTSLCVIDKDMERFNTDWELQEKIADRKKKFEKDNCIKATKAYDELEEICHISVTTMKKSINGTQKITRTFLYKFTVGLGMGIDEANEFFMLCGGKLNDDCREDYICRKALDDRDDIFTFIEQYEYFTKMKIDMTNRSCDKRS